MRSYILLIPLAGLLIAADANDDAIKKEKAALRGTWQATDLKDWTGLNGPEDQLRNIGLVITDTKVTIKEAGKEVPAHYTIDPAKKEIDITPIEGEKQGKALKALYKLDGDTLSMCNGKLGTPRPKEFKVSKDPNVVIITFKRVK